MAPLLYVSVLLLDEIDKKQIEDDTHIVQHSYKDQGDDIIFF